MAGGDPAAHQGYVSGVLALKDGRLVSWGSDKVIRFWDRWARPLSIPWLATEPLQNVSVVNNEVWLFLTRSPV